MKALDAIIRKKGFTYFQLFHSEYGYLYRQVSDGNTVGYEVFRHRTHKERTIADRIIPPSVAFPPDEAFGVWAWTYRDLDSAMDKYTSLLLDAQTTADHE